MATDECGNNDSIIDGGSIANSSIADSTMVNSTVSASTIDKSTITGLTSIDPATAKVIADAIASLPTDQLATLAKVIFSAYSGTPINAPANTETPSLPVKVVGGRTELLGSPTAWVAMGGYALPLYTK